MAALVAIAVPAHVAVTRIRRPLVKDLELSAGGVIRPLAAILHVVAFLLYLGFGAAAVPFDFIGAAGPHDIEGVLDTIALFAVLVAAIQLASLLILHRVAGNLEPWPPSVAESMAS